MTDPCCPDTNDLLTKIVNLLEGGMTADIRFSGGSTPPDTTAGNCAPAFFDHDTDETGDDLIQRSKALCITCERYVKAVLIGGLTDMGAPQALIDWVDSQYPQTVPLPFTKLTIVYPSVLEGLAAFFDALAGGAELNAIACQMITALQGNKNNTFSNFKASVTAESMTSLLVPLAGLVQSTNGVKNNYQLFNDALELANDEDLSAYECPCEIAPDCGLDMQGYPSFVVDDGEMTIELIAPDIYHITQTGHAGEDGKYRASLYDVNGNCFICRQAPDYEDFPEIDLSSNLHCCDDDEVAQPGFMGEDLKRLHWRQDAPIDVHIKIVCSSTVCP